MCCGSRGEWRELAELDPADEDTHMQLMRRHIDAGDEARLRSSSSTISSGCSIATSGSFRAAAVRQARLEASRLESTASSRLEYLLAEMADLVSRQSAVLAELAAADVAPPCCVP